MEAERGTATKRAAGRTPVVVIGGGPAGLLAASRSASLGAQVVLLERTALLGTKLRLSGGGRCNLSNTAPIDAFLAHFGPSFFLRNALARFSSQDLIAFLEARGVPVRVEADGRVFPASGSAHQVAEALIRYSGEQGVRVRTSSRVTALIHAEGRLQGVLLEGGETLAARAAIVATGGASYPRTGSTGDGYRLAAAAGHTIVPVHPALTPLVVQGSEPRALAGLSLAGIQARLLIDGSEVESATGDLLFTHDGLSGPAVLALSGAATSPAAQGLVEVSLNLWPSLGRDDLDARMTLSLTRSGRRAARSWLKAWAPARLADLLLRRAAVSPARPACQLSASERERLRRLLQDLRFLVTGHGSWDEAMLTAGGVDTREVDPRTMGSRLVAGLLFAGEVLDLQAGTGGFNLQAAFSTGWVAGTAAEHLASRPPAGMLCDGQRAAEPGQRAAVPRPPSEQSPHGN
ncbi:MAG TPA: NAD(P)/FAD-dependent oxidoreductase [Anaerolineae bacterium]|nr:NAD(P)/FAD-dependent oxidoreductase [Anaerolineae bacterium]